MVFSFFLSFSFFIFGFWFLVLVFYCRVTRVARGVFLGWALGWVGVGVIYNTGKICPRLDYRYMLPFLIYEMGGGMEGRRRQDGRVAAASGRFC